MIVDTAAQISGLHRLIEIADGWMHPWNQSMVFIVVVEGIVGSMLRLSV